MATDASSKTARIVISAVIAVAIIAAAVGLGVVAGSGDEEPAAASTTTVPAPSTTTPPDRGETTTPDSTVPATATFEFVEFDGTEDILAHHAGKPLVVNFFASWCPPCRAELPDFADAHARYGSEVNFLGVDIQEPSREAAEELLRETGIVYTITEDPDADIYADLGGIGAMPTTIFIDVNGEVSERAHGIIFADQLEEEIEALLG